MDNVNNQKLICIGKIHSSQGLKGQVFVVFKATETPWMKALKTLSLSQNAEGPVTMSLPITHKKEHFKQGKQGWAVALAGIDNKTQADELEKLWVWIPEELLVSKKGETIYLREIENFLVVDRARGEVGPIIGFSSNGPQDLIEVQTSTGTYDVPLVDAFIEKIDYKTKTIFMDIPQGLLEDV